jgi:aminoglycoside 6'-N-acetyltransferase
VIEFRPIVEGDLGLLLDWLHREHVNRWWRGDPTYDEVVEHYLRSGQEHYLIVVDGRPAGMIQTYLVADDPEWEAIVGAEPGLAGVDLLIGEEDLVGRGLGPEVLLAFVRDLVFARPATSACVATVEEANRRSWRAFEKAGFRHVRDVEEEGRPHRLMRLDRPAQS